MQQHNNTFTHPFSQKPFIQQATPIPSLSSANLLLNNFSGYNQYPTTSTPLYQTFDSRPSIPSAVPLVTNRLNGHHSFNNLQNSSATTISPPSSSYSIPATAIAANTFASSPSATSSSSSTLNGFLSKPILSQQQVITLTIYRTTFNTKRSVELVQSSLQYKTHTRINIVRGKTGKVEISGKAPNVFEVGLFILEEIILRQRPVLWPLIMFSFWQNQSLEYMFFPCGEGDCKFQPKSFNETSLISQTSEQTLQQYQQPIIFLKKISIPSQNTLLQQFLQQNHTQSINAASIWRLNAIKYSSHGSSLVQNMTRYGEGNSQQGSNRRQQTQTTQQSQQQPIIPTVRIDSQHAVLLFAGTLQQVQEVHHKYIAAALGSLNDLKLVESFNILQTKQTNKLSSLSSSYNPQQVLSFQYSPSMKKLLINPSSVPSLAIMLPAEGLDLNEGYDECKSKGHHRSSSTILSPTQFDKRFEKLLLALQHSEVGKQLLHQGASSSGGMFVMMRDSFHKIANTRYMDDPKNAFEIQVYREKGVIYLDSHIIHLANVSSSVAHQLQLSATGVVDKLTYHNNKFVELSVVPEDSLYSLQNLSLNGTSKENTSTSKSSNTCSDTSFPIIGEFEKYCTVVSAKLGSHNLLIAGQVDAASAARSTYSQSEISSDNVTVVNSKPAYDLSNYLEIKTCGSLEERDKDHYKRETLLSLFILSYSIGIQKIIGGYVDRDKKGTLKKVEVKKLPDLVQEADGLWEPEEVLTFVEQVLAWIKANTQEGKHYTMVFAPPSSHVVLLENTGTKSVHIK